MSDHKLPPSLNSEGAELATFDAIISVALILSEHMPDFRDQFSEMLLQRFAQHQTPADEHGTSVNVNAASALRLMMIQIGCNNIPDHQ